VAFIEVIVIFFVVVRDHLLIILLLVVLIVVFALTVKLAVLKLSITKLLKDLISEASISFSFKLL
jgi:hypothetical protein